MCLTYRQKFTVEYFEHLTVYVFAHNKNQMYIPNMSKLYGTATQIIKLLPEDKSYFAEIDLAKIHMKSLDQSNDRCAKTTEKLDASTCIAKYIDDKLGCGFPLYKSTSVKSKCNTSSQYKQLLNITERLQSGNATEIYEMTGCLSSCERDIYRMEKAAKKSIDRWTGSQQWLQLKFSFETGI
jgi:hypothetical protein